MNRKQIYNILYDMLKQGDISGAQLFEICTSQIKHESATDVLGDVFNYIIPSIIKRYLPPKVYLESHDEICNIVF